MAVQSLWMAVGIYLWVMVVSVAFIVALKRIDKR